MIAKITSGGNYLGLLSYLENKKDKSESTEDGMEVLLGTERIFIDKFSLDQDITLLSDKQTLHDDFEDWDSMSKNRNFEKKVAHFSLSFAPHDTIDKERIIIVARDFLEKMGYQNNPVVIYQHNDKHHNHIHIVTSRVGEDGKKIDHNHEAIRAISICRKLEVKYDLTQVVQGELKQNNLEQPASNTIMASADTSFRNVIVQNLQYYLNTEQVKDMDTLQKMLQLHNIEMVLHDKDGNRLPRNGVRFYFKEGNKIISYISGSEIEKGFISKLEKIFLANDKGIQTVEKVQVDKQNERNDLIPTLKPSFSIQKSIGNILFDAMESCAKSILVTPADLIKILAVHKIVPEFKVDTKGNLTGLSFIYDNVRYKGSDFVVKGVKLSAALLAPHFLETVNGAKVVQFAIDSVQKYIKLTGDVLLSKQEIVEILNRQNIRLVESVDGKFSLVINQLGKQLSINLENYPGGYVAFLKAVGYDGKPDFLKDLKEKLFKPTFLTKPLGFEEKLVYNSLLKGNIKDIQENSKLQVQLRLTPIETVKLAKPLVLLNYYNGIHNKMARAGTYLGYQAKSTTKPSFYEIVRSLNLRGITVNPVFKDVESDSKPKLKTIEFTLKGEKTNLPLNMFQTVPEFSAEKFMVMFDNLSLKDEQLLASTPKEPGIYFEFSDEITAMILAAETDPSLIHEFKEEILEQHPELANEIAYIEGLEDTGGLYVYPDAPETHYLSTLFKDHGTMVNRGGDISNFKALKRKKAKKL